VLSPADAELAHRDTAIPGLATVLDPEAFLHALCTALPEVAIDSAIATYVRYKPGMNCLVAYKLTVGGGEVDSYAKAHRPDAHEQFQKALEKPGVDGPLGTGRIVLQHQAIVISIFPNDNELKVLYRLDETEMWSRLLRRVFPQRPDLWAASLQGIRYKPERRYVAQLVTSGEPQAVLKLYTGTGYKEAKGNAKGFRSGKILRVPRTLGHSDKHGVLAFEWMEGQLLSDALSDPHLNLSMVEKVGAALAEVHAQKSDRLSYLSRESEVSSLLSVSAGLEFLCPHIDSSVNRFARRLASHLLREPALSLPVHGDFYAKQVLLAGDKVVILDFDSAVSGDPAADLGLFIAHLERGAMRRSLPSSRVEPVRYALLHGYSMATHLPVPERVGLYTAVGLLRLAPHPFRNRHAHWLQDVEATVARAEAIYSDSISETLQGLAPVSGDHNRSKAVQMDEAPVVSVVDPFGVTTDPTMPFLTQALGPHDVQLQFSRRLAHLAGPGGKLEVLAIRAMRHKRGRRCLVEYDLAIHGPDSPPELVTLVGKARARGLDRSTFETISALWKAGFNDSAPDGISVPQPIGMVPEFQMWLHRKVPGTPATHLLAGPRGIDLARRIAEAAHKVYMSGVRPTRRHTMQDELRILHERLPLVAHTRPEWALRIAELLQACDRLASRVTRRPRQGIHRDFYADQVLVDGPRLYLLDFDLYCEGDPGLDIGNFLGHMQEWGLRTQGDPQALSAQEDAMEERFVELSGEPARSAVRAYTLLTLVRHVYLSTQYAGRQQLTETLLELCEERLSRALEPRGVILSR
jgi:Ser/Thr protein kinase RdoA (MazF antagonist)